ncbi:hypothetical protein [Amycolatopsis plumensis]|uniref:Uncharacterized protein n=1 Tax=Amycolatopsis plumensis TaxID=236508 RepID=A0ABV5U407_9PSEU
MSSSIGPWRERSRMQVAQRPRLSLAVKAAFEDRHFALDVPEVLLDLDIPGEPLREDVAVAGPEGVADAET